MLDELSLEAVVRLVTMELASTSRQALFVGAEGEPNELRKEEIRRKWWSYRLMPPTESFCLGDDGIS
jgi:hypothetical protein